MAANSMSQLPSVSTLKGPVGSLPVTSPTFALNLAFNEKAFQELTNMNDVNRFLHETVAKERSIDAELEQLLSRRTEIEQSLTVLHASTSEMLEVVRADAEQLCSSVESTSLLAERVSSKVRELDLSQTHVQDTLKRINMIVDRTNCIDGVKDALSHGDLERAASYVAMFLELEESAGSLLTQVDSLQVQEQKEVLDEARRNLEELVQQRFSEAARKQHHENILRYLKLYKPLRIQDEGLQAFTSYVQDMIVQRAKEDYDKLIDSFSGDNQPDFIEALSNLLKLIVSAVLENEELLRDVFGPQAVVSVIERWHQTCDSDGTKVLQRYVSYRQLPRLVKDIGRSGKAAGAGERTAVDPRQVESYLDELLVLCQSSEEYTQILLQKISECSVSSPGGSNNRNQQLEQTLKGGAFNNAVRELVSYYISLEEYYMEESVNKAIRIDDYTAESLTSSMVDDVFFILQKCCGRAVGSGKVMSTAAVFSHSNILLSSAYKDALASKLQGAAARLLQSASAGAERDLGVLQPVAASGQVASPFNNADVSAGYVLKLRQQLEELVVEAFPATQEREKLKSVLADLGKTSGDFKQITTKALDQLCGGIMPRLRPVLDAVSAVSYELSESEYAANEVADTWVQQLLSGLAATLSWMQPLLTPNNYDNLFHLVLDKVVSRMEAIMLSKRFNQLGGLQLDRDVRVLVAQLSEITQRTVRDKFSRLNQMATVLGLETAHEILDYWGDNSGPITWRLTEADVRQVLGQRVDFSRQEIATLPL